MSVRNGATQANPATRLDETRLGDLRADLSEFEFRRCDGNGFAGSNGSTTRGRTSLNSLNSHIRIHRGDALDLYDSWETPTVIISDGPYGIGGFPGDPPTHDGLAEWYEPHIQKWSEIATPQTTLWFWNTEVGWATVHPVLLKHGWDYRAFHVWDKGLSHIAGNVNSKTIRKIPVVTEACVQYTKAPQFAADGGILSTKEWLRFEWKRTGLPFSHANQACDVKDAATRKYFTLSHLWYFPPGEAFEKLQTYANEFGEAEGRPYFSLDGKAPVSKSEWENLRPKFNHKHGITNVWSEPPVNGKERLKNGAKPIHLNQKPLSLMSRIICASSDEGDTVWEPFGGLFSGLYAAMELNRNGTGSEICPKVFKQAFHRFEVRILQSKTLIKFRSSK